MPNGSPETIVEALKKVADDVESIFPRAFLYCGRCVGKSPPQTLIRGLIEPIVSTECVECVKVGCVRKPVSRQQNTGAVLYLQSLKIRCLFNECAIRCFCLEVISYKAQEKCPD